MSSKWRDDTAFACKCCGNFPEQGLDQMVLDAYDYICNNFGFALEVNCMYRCPSHNAEVGGAPHSNHMYGLAMDIDATQVGVDALADYAESIGVPGVLRYYNSGFVHIDYRDVPYRDVMD